MIPRHLRLFLLALLTLFSTPAWAKTFPAFTGLVVDQAGILPPDRKAALEVKLQAFQHASKEQGVGRQLVVATVSSLEGDEIQDYGYKLGRAWGVGLKGADSGTILLIAPNERKIGIETGPGVQGVLTDAYSSVIINTKIRPAFKGGDMPGGIDAGVAALTDILSQPDDQARAKGAAAIAAYNKAHQRSGGGGAAAGFIVWIVIIGFFILFATLRRRGQGTRYVGGSGAVGGGTGGGNWPILLWALDEALSSRHSGGSWGGGSDLGGSSGSSGSGGGWGDGGFSGGGGGSFDGGGASGSW